MTQFDTDKLRRLAKNDLMARNVFLALASRERPREVCDLNRLRLFMVHYNLPMNTRAFYHVFRKLQRLGYGQLSPGWGNSPSRFHFTVNYIELAKAALVGLNTTPVLPIRKPTPAPKTEPKPELPPAATQVKVKQYVTIFMPVTGQPIKIVSTRELTAEEVLHYMEASRMEMGA